VDPGGEREGGGVAATGARVSSAGDAAAWDVADREDRRAALRCRAGDQAAFVALVARHERPLMATAYHLLRDRDDAADAVQETFLRAYRALDRYDDAQRFGAWLGRIGVNVCLSMLRARRDRPAAAPGAWEYGRTEPAYARAEQAIVLRGALAPLSPQDRAILLLRHVHGLSSAEIGEAVGLPPATVRTRLARGLRAVRTALPDLADLIEPDEGRGAARPLAAGEEG
jgi:RNA polymerase sigma-70 factor (ECF subfamily)